MKGTGLTIGAAIFWSSWLGKGFFRKPTLENKQSAPDQVDLYTDNEEKLFPENLLFQNFIHE